MKIDTGDTAWLLFSICLVMLMTPGLGLFYAGMARRKNVLGTIMHSITLLCVVSLIWVIWGYTIAFGPDKGGIIGSLEWFGLKGVGPEPGRYSSTVPHLGFMVFQGMFAVITPALIAGAFAERIKFSAFLMFTVLWVTFVYSPLAHWVWGGGWIGSVLGALDFAGGTVVHISSGVAGLISAYVIGSRKGHGIQPMPPHNRTLTVTGAALLWFGWFGFNAGSALSAGGIATTALVNTNTSASAAALAWILIEWIHRGRPTLIGAVSGSIAGLVAITPASGYVSPILSILIGTVAAAFCYAAVMLKQRFGYDDSFDVFAIHAVGGTWGVLGTGLFASTAVNPAGLDGLFYGNPPLVGIQAIAVVVTYIYVSLYTFVILKIVDLIIGLRVDEESELIGLDYTQHRESGYNLKLG